MRYTGVRYEQYLTIKTAYRGGDIEKRVYDSGVKELNRKERLAVARRDTEAIRARAETGRIIREASEAKRNIILDLRGKGKKSTFMGKGKDYNDIILNASKKIKDSRVFVQISVDGKVIKSGIVETYGGDYKAKYFNKLFGFIHEDDYDNADTFVWDSYPKKPFRIVIYASESVPAKKITQAFLAGPTHCVLQPLISIWEGYANNCESVGSKKRLNQIVRKLQGMLPIYKDGVPEADLPLIGQAISRCIVVKDLLNLSEARYNVKSTQDFVFTNTRKNHLDTGVLAIGEKYEPLDEGQFGNIIRDHEKDGTFMLTKQGSDGIVALRSTKGAWVLENKDKEFYDDMNLLNGIRNYRLDARKYPQVNAFIKEGKIVHSGAISLCADPNNLEGVTHADMKKAYTQHKNTGKYYKRFPGAITHYCRFATPITDMSFLETHIGFFQVRLSNVPVNYLRILGLCTGVFILPSVEIQYLADEGITCEILAGCWARHTFDISYTDAMMEKDRQGHSRYAMWAGKLSQENSVEHYTFEGDTEWASHLTAELGSENVSWIAFKNQIQVTVPHPWLVTTHHVFAFITAYARINMLMLMKAITGTLVKVVLDGLYFKGTLGSTSVDVAFDKPIKEHGGFAYSWYYPTAFSTEDFPIYNPSFDPPVGVNHIVLTGAGGTGKSYSVYKNSNLINSLYVVASKALGEDKREEFGCNFATIHRMLGDISGSVCAPYTDKYPVPAVGMADEITQYDKAWIDTLLLRYPKTFWLIAGDVDYDRWYQCRGGCDKKMYDIWLPSRTDFVVPYLTDHRSKDDELRILKERSRERMKLLFTDGGEKDAYQMALWLIRNYKKHCVTIEKALKIFKKGDIVLAGKHSTNKMLIKNDIVSGAQNKNTRRLYYDSDIPESIQPKDLDIRGSFTVHSFQGLTIEDKRVFICLDFFEYSMLVTALGRVRNMSQLVFIT